MGNRQIKFEDFKEKHKSLLIKRELIKFVNQDNAWMVETDNIKVSIIKWSSDSYYKDDYEIWDYGVNMDDVEIFATMEEVLIRLTEMENK